MIDQINTRISELEAERETLRARLQLQLERDVAELNARANAAIEPYSAAIGELKRLVGLIEASTTPTGCGVAEHP